MVAIESTRADYLRLPGRALAALLRLTLPPGCLACDAPVAEDGGLCPRCWGGLDLIAPPFCPRLAIPFAYDLGPGALSAEAIAEPPPFDRMRAVAAFGDTSRRLVHGLKYRDRMELGRWMAGWMARAGGELIAGADLVAPVPLHWRRQWHRRFNQSAVLARHVAELGGRPYAPLLVSRIRATATQVGLNPRQRARNLAGAMRVPLAEKPALRGKRVLLVDDVFTTGATARAATRALLRAGAGAVDVLVFARVVRSRE